MILSVISGLLVILGAVFFLAGTVGLLRFPDIYTRLHSLTKADNLGLGLTVVGLMLTAGGPGEILKLLLIWLLVLMASGTIGYLVANTALHRGIKPWQAPPR